MFNRFSAYGRPINVCLSQGFQLSPQYFIFRKGSIRVLIDNGLGYFTDILQKLSVAGYIRYFQIKAMPLCWVPSKSPGPRSFKSASAISKPSFVRTIISKRFRVSSANL